ncbi:hypothetical protein SAMD00019534_125540, partial [Acytostelium subglobosum LB1]|uniref:hypothetical protein n=1 Tax=Acytostelium subglobosum LB1 TaxID=1410327 RepID=UPI000644E84D
MNRDFNIIMAWDTMTFSLLSLAEQRQFVMRLLSGPMTSGEPTERISRESRRKITSYIVFSEEHLNRQLRMTENNAIHYANLYDQVQAHAELLEANVIPGYSAKLELHKEALRTLSDQQKELSFDELHHFFQTIEDQALAA